MPHPPLKRYDRAEKVEDGVLYYWRDQLVDFEYTPRRRTKKELVDEAADLKRSRRRLRELNRTAAKIARQLRWGNGRRHLLTWDYDGKSKPRPVIVGWLLSGYGPHRVGDGISPHDSHAYVLAKDGKLGTVYFASDGRNYIHCYEFAEGSWGIGGPDTLAEAFALLEALVRRCA